jgi:uncharacterized damage-inducible protein DinB
MIEQVKPMAAELQQEAAITRRVLDRIPADKLDWRPHPHSMSLGELALHIAVNPGDLAKLAALDGLDFATANFHPPQPASKEEVLRTFEQGIVAAEAYLNQLSEAEAMGPWTARNGKQELFTMPRIALLRSIMLNHWYHHRGQMSVYLRLLGVKVPVIYGRSYDESPFELEVGTSA